MSTSPSPDELRARLESCEKKATFNDFTSRLQDLANTAGRFKPDLAQLRQRGYAFAAQLEQQAADLPNQLSSAKSSAETLITTNAQRLRVAIERARVMKQADIIARIESDVSDIENQIRNSFSTIEGAVGEVSSQLYKIKWYLDQRDEASFKFLAGEAVFNACEAEWIASGRDKDDPDGILFLTDQRLVFEQKETTGKTLGFFGGKKVHELEWEIPLHQIADATHENKGFLGGKDMVHLTLKPGAKFDQITLEVKGGVPCKWWVAQLKRLLAGEAQTEKVGAPDAAATQDRLANAPTRCPACNGQLPMLVAGQMQIECPHCGTVVRV